MKLKKGILALGALAFRSVTVTSVCEISALSDDTVSLAMGKPEKTDLVLTQFQPVKGPHVFILVFMHINPKKKAPHFKFNFQTNGFT